jgi:putative sigma-54 modulation protein
MDIQIQSIHFKADHKLREYINKKVEKLSTFYDGIIDAQVYLKVENTSLKENKIVEIKVNAKHNSFIKTEVAQSFEAAADSAVEGLKKQVKRHKGRLEVY